MLIMICGLPGTGKSLLGKEIEKRTRAFLLRTDEVRKRITENPEYSEKEKEEVYRTFFMIAEYLAKSGKDVILDGTFYRKEYRKMAAELAKDLSEELKIIECTNLEERVKRKMEERKDISDADFSVYGKIKKMWEPITEEHLILKMNEFFDDREKGMEIVMGYIS